MPALADIQNPRGAEGMKAPMWRERAEVTCIGRQDWVLELQPPPALPALLCGQTAHSSEPVFPGGVTQTVSTA